MKPATIMTPAGAIVYNSTTGTVGVIAHTAANITMGIREAINEHACTLGVEVASPFPHYDDCYIITLEGAKETWNLSDMQVIEKGDIADRFDENFPQKFPHHIITKLTALHKAHKLPTPTQ